MKLVDIGVSKSPAGNGVRVRVPPAAPKISGLTFDQKKALAYITGIALGDGNLSNPNGRAVRLRVICDNNYPKLGNEIIAALQFLLPKNKVSVYRRRVDNCFEVYVYSNLLGDWMPWKVGMGPKARQGARVPSWIRRDLLFTQLCLRGLIQTDGCIYTDRGYRMVNFTNNNRLLAEDARDMFVQIGYNPSFMTVKLGPNQYKYTARVARNAEKLIDELSLYKA